MKGYGVASWLKKEEYKNYFMTANYQQDTDGGMSLRINRLNPQNKKSYDTLARSNMPNLCKWLSVGNYTGNMGLAAGGMDDGSVMIWDIDTLYKEGDTYTDNSSSSALLSAQLVHEGGSVNDIEFNPNIHNLIASGGSEVLIQDIQHSIEEPNVFVPGEPNFHEGAVVTAVSWNKVVPYILASTGNDGSIVVWDLKNSKAIFNLKDPNLVDYAYDPFSENKDEQVTANYNIIWSLQVPTQFLISNDNETMTMWDLRKSDTPLLSLSDIHSSGVLSSAWCPQDHNIIASSSTDGKTCFFHSETGDLISEIHDGKKYIDMEWSPYNRGLILGYTTDDETNIFDFSSTNSKNDTSDSSYAPKWLSRPLGARFGFGGKLVTFTSNPQEPIKLYQTQAMPEISTRLESLEESKSQNELTEIIDDYVQKSSKNEIERMEWLTIRSLCTKNYDALFELMDIDKETVFNEAERFSGKKKHKGKPKGDSSTKAHKDGLSSLDATQANEFFATLAETSDKRKEEEEKKVETKIGPKVVQETISRNSNWDEGAEGIIKRNLLIGNIEGAAECALKCGRTAEAFLLALNSKDENVFEQIKQEYFEHNKDSFVNTIIKGITNEEIEDMVLELAQSNWKEALAYALSYTPNSMIPQIVEKIGEHILQKKRDVNSALICYMVSQNINKVADLWKIRADAIIKKNPQHKYAIYSNYAEKITFYRLATRMHNPTEFSDAIIGELAEYLANEGLYEIAHKYLDVNGCKSGLCEKVRERIFYLNETKNSQSFKRPKYQHPGHQFPRIVPRNAQNPQATGGNGRGGFNRSNVQRGANPFANAPTQPTQFNPQAVAQQTPQPPQPTQNKHSKANKNANFGYSTTHPALISENEESKVDFANRHNKGRKQKQTPPIGNAQIFDPSKAENNPPPPRPGQRHPASTVDVRQSQELYHQPPIQSFNQIDPRASQNSFNPPSFANQSLEPAPVIAATNVKPPTAQMKAKVKGPMQRYAPPPRFQNNDPPQQDQPRVMNPSMAAPNPPPMSGGISTGAMPATRGKAPPPARGRGGGPPPMRGGPAGGGRAPPGGIGHPPPTGGMGHAPSPGGMGHAPSPGGMGHTPSPGGMGQPPSSFPQGAPGGGMAAPMQPPVGAPPPPKIGRRK